MWMFLRKLSLFLMTHLAIWAIILSVYVKQKPFSLELGAANKDKQRLLEQAASPRLILIGGSNLLFGINSPELEKRTGYHPINMGVNVGDGLAFMLNNVAPWVRRGDVIVISPEYEHFGSFYYGKGEFLYAELEQRPAAIRSFASGNMVEVLNKGFIIAGNVFRYTVDGKNKILKAYLEDNGAVYRRAAVNDYGDIVGHYNRPERLEIKDLPIAGTDATPETMVRAINGLNQFSLACERRGARVYFSFPPIPRELLGRRTADTQSIAENLQRLLRFPILDTPVEMSFPLENFYDGYYHLTFEGGLRRTDKLIESLKSKGALQP